LSVINNWGDRLRKGGNLLTDAAQIFLFVPIPAKAKMLGLLSIYKFSLDQTDQGDETEGLEREGLERER
jgi:hypothetical protein